MDLLKKNGPNLIILSIQEDSNGDLVKHVFFVENNLNIMKLKHILIKCFMLIAIITFHANCLAQSNKLKQSQLINAVKNKMSVNSMKMLSKKDIDATDKFVYSVSNGSILEDTPYKITVSEGFVSISIKTNTSNIDETFAITDSQYSSFKKDLYKADIRIERNKSVIGICGAPCIELSLFKHLNNYFKYDTLDSDNNLTYTSSLEDIFWKLIPASLDELLSSINDINEFDVE